MLSHPQFRLSIVVGLAGMGKTALGVEVAHRHQQQRVFWHTFTQFDTAFRFLGIARQWLAASDGRRSKWFDEVDGDIADLLDRVTHGLSRQRALIILDDYQKVHDDGIHEIVHRWKNTAVGARIIVLSRTRPPFNLDPATQLLLLTGLDQAASLCLLRECGLEAPRARLAQLHRAFGGHPLSLRLSAQAPGDLQRTARLAVEDIGRGAYEALDRESRKVLLALVAIRRPLRLEDIRFLTGLKDPTLPLAVLERRALAHFDGMSYRVHDVLRAALASVIASGPEIHRRAYALLLPSVRDEDLIEAMDHAAEAGDWSIAGDLLERKMEAERNLFAGGDTPPAFLDVLNRITAEKLSPRHRYLFHRAHAVASVGIVRASAVIQELDMARRIAEGLQDPSLVAPVLLQLGWYRLSFLRPARSAERLYLQALRLLQADGGSAVTAHALMCLAMLHNRQGHHARAGEYWRLAYRAAKASGDEDLVLELMTWPVAYSSAPTTMNRRLRLLRAAFRRSGRTNLVAAVDVQIGENLCRAQRGRKQPKVEEVREACERLERASTALETLGDHGTAGTARSWLALAFLLEKRHEEAESIASDLLKEGMRTGISHESVLIHQVLSRLRLVKGDAIGARHHANEALRLAKRMDCSCVGITMLERALLEKVPPRDQLARAVAQTVRRGQSDEMRFARGVALAHGLDRMAPPRP